MPKEVNIPKKKPGFDHGVREARMDSKKESHDSLAVAAGNGVSLDIKGETYHITPITIGDLADFESFIQSSQLKTFFESGATKYMDADERKAIVVEICTGGLGEGVVAREMNTLSGVRFLLWKSLSRKHPNLTLEKVSSLVDINNLEEVAAIVQTIGAGEVDESHPTGEEETA